MSGTTSNKGKFLIVGGGGRESIFAQRLIEDSILFAVVSHRNPSIIDCVESSGGEYIIGDASNPEVVLDFAQKHDIDYAFINADDPLANGVVDALLDGGIKAIGGTKAATRIEWDKIYSIGMMQKVCPEFTPFFKIVSKQEELEEAIESFVQKHLQVVVKPQGLTGGKGVKVMPEHLKTYRDGRDYAAQLLEKNPAEQVLLVERLKGIEFTVMGFTDGQNLILSPASYDYPFRHEDDLGAGTGGMGCFTSAESKLPFMSEQDLRDCTFIMQKIIDEIRHRDLFFNGVLNGGFFKTSDGIKFMEFNGRFGDPESLNVLMTLKSSFSKLLERIWEKKLAEDDVEFVKQASVVKYLVAEEYPQSSVEATSFSVDEEAIRAMGVRLFFASCEKAAGAYKTLKKSRVAALGAVSDDIAAASELVNEAIRRHVSGNLDYRSDIGSKKSLEKLERVLSDMNATK